MAEQDHLPASSSASETYFPIKIPQRRSFRRTWNQA